MVAEPVAELEHAAQQAEHLPLLKAAWACSMD
jgi:hypothetical protein